MLNAPRVRQLTAGLEFEKAMQGSLTAKLDVFECDFLLFPTV